VRLGRRGSDGGHDKRNERDPAHGSRHTTMAPVPYAPR
jgi:hypothetical protein